MAHPFSSFLEVYFLAQLSSQFKVAILSVVVCGKMVFPHLVDVISDSTLGDASPGSHCVHSHGVNGSFINLDIHRHVVPTAFPPEEDNAAEMAMKQDPQLYKQVLEVQPAPQWVVVTDDDAFIRLEKLVDWLNSPAAADPQKPAAVGGRTLPQDAQDRLGQPLLHPDARRDPRPAPARRRPARRPPGCSPEREPASPSPPGTP